jgi:hypothetical protein
MPDNAESKERFYERISSWRKPKSKVTEDELYWKYLGDPEGRKKARLRDMTQRARRL